MAIVIALLFIALCFSKAARLLSLGAAGLLGSYIVWDNVFTESAAAVQVIGVRSATADIIGDPGISVPVHVQLQIQNNASAELESVDARVTLLDCPIQSRSGDCEPIARKQTRLQLLAPIGRSRRTDGWVYFDNVPQVTGAMRVGVAVVGGVLDWR